MKRHVVFICNTAYQLFAVMQLRMTEYSQENVDIILSNQFSASHLIAENIRKSGLFGRVMYIENKKQTFSSRLKETLHDIKLIKNLRRELGKADEVCFSNISVFTILFTRFYQCKTPKISIFEDGFVTYSKAFENMDRVTVFSRILLPDGILGKASRIWLFSPELLDWHRDNIEVSKIAPIDKLDKKVVGTLNSIFGYDSNGDIYDRKFLFMEESFFADKYPVNDEEIVKGIADVVGRENLMVKLHPRNSENRFAPMGIKTNTTFGTPWELIALNQDIQNCTLISISSSSILQPYLLFGMPLRCYALLKTLNERPGNMKGVLGDFMADLFAKFPDVCVCPETLELFYEQIKK